MTGKQAALQRQDLAEREARIEMARRAAFAVVGTELREIRDGKLWMLGYKTFAAYCEQRWDMGLRSAERAMEAAAVVTALEGDNLSPILPLPAAESHARALAGVRMELRAGVWERAVEQTGGRPTAKAVEAAGREAEAAWGAAEAGKTGETRSPPGSPAMSSSRSLLPQVTARLTKLSRR